MKILSLIALVPFAFLVVGYACGLVADLIDPDSIEDQYTQPKEEEKK